jgi:hypothetical protein
MDGATLYQTLSVNLRSEVMTKKGMADLSSRLENLPEDRRKAAAQLIIAHSRLNSDSTKINVKNPKLPYEGVQNGEDVEFDVANFPNELKWVLEKFVNIN